MAITPKTYPNILKYGLQASYNALATKDTNVLYFCTDTGKIYKGDVDFTNSVLVVTTKPTTPVVGKVYVVGDTGTVEAYDGSAWHVLSYPTVAEITATSTDEQVPSAKAVYTFVTKLVSDLAGSENTVSKIENKAETEATIVYTTADGTTHDLVLAGVVTTPSYDATTRKFTFPVSDGNAVVVDLGKDVFINPNAQNGYNAETQEIWLYLNDGSGETEDTLIKVPAAGLVDIYTGETTATVTVSVSDDNKISAVVNVKADSEGFTNALKVDENGGLYVDLSAYAIADEVEERVAGVEDKAEAAQATADENKAAIATLNGDAQTAGSVDKKIADAVAGLTGGDIKALQDAVAAAQTTADKGVADAATAQGAADAAQAAAEAAQATADTGVANAATAQAAAEAAQTAADNAQATADQNAADIAALAAATTVWGTF